jgi:hypothetical protein
LASGFMPGVNKRYRRKYCRHLKNRQLADDERNNRIRDATAGNIKNGWKHAHYRKVRKSGELCGQLKLNYSLTIFLTTELPLVS